MLVFLVLVQSRFLIINIALSVQGPCLQSTGAGVHVRFCEVEAALCFVSMCMDSDLEIRGYDE